VSVEIVEEQISKTFKDSAIWIWFLRVCIVALILAIIWCGYLAITQSWFCWLVEAVLVPVLGLAIKAYSDQNQANIDFLSALNETQTIANNQDEILRRIRMEELADKEKGG